MKLFTILFAIALFSHSTFAAGVFGPATTLKSLSGIDQKGCEAPKILEQEYLKNGINIVDGTARYVWNCTGVTAEKAVVKRCPFPQNVKPNTSMKCFSNTSTGGPVVCVSGPHAETVDAVYGDEGNVTEHQPRFNELVVITDDSSGFRKDRHITMDAQGCKVESVRGQDSVGEMNNGTYTSTFADCTRLFDAALNGGNMYDSNISKVKYCDPNDKSEGRVNAYWTKTKDLFHCFEDIPDFLGRYKASKTVSAPTTPKSVKATQ